MPTINGRACVVDGKPVDKVFSNGKQVYGRNLLLDSAKEASLVGNSANGTPGNPGTDGKTPYFHIAYANSADGTLDFTPDYKSAVGLDTVDISKWAKNAPMSNSTYKVNSNTDGSFKVTGYGAIYYEVLSKSFQAKVGDKLRFTVRYTNRLAFGLYNNYGLQFVVNNAYTESVASTSKIVLPNTITASTEYQLEYTATSSNVWMQLNFGGVDDGSQVDFDVKIEVENLTNPVEYAFMGTYTDYTSNDSNDPSKYTWVKVKDYEYRFSFGKISNIPAKVGDPVTVSADILVTGTSPSGTFLFQFSKTPWPILGNIIFNISDFTIGEKKRVTFSTTVSSSWLDSTNLATGIMIRMDNVPTTITLAVSKWKFELGNTPTAWYPSPEDVM